jgi:hypothetical protein
MIELNTTVDALPTAERPVVAHWSGDAGIGGSDDGHGGTEQIEPVGYENSIITPQRSIG